ncbi:L-type lectin-domain containing receptor kinase IV.2 [Linum grandiflorum]
MAFIQFLLLLSTLTISSSSSTPDQFAFNGFNTDGAKTNKLNLDGEAAEIQPNGLLRLTNSTPLQMGHAYFPSPLNFSSSSSLSFSTTFIFAMLPQSPNLGGHGLAFFLSPTVDFTHAVASQHLGLFNATTDGVAANHVLAIEFDAMRSPEFQDIDNNHVGVDVYSLISIDAAPASFINPDGKNLTLELLSGKPIRVWIDYNDTQKLIHVTLAPIDGVRPKRSLLSTKVDLGDVLSESMYVGFSAATSTVTSEHYILGWSFSKGGIGKAEELDVSKLPKLPPLKKAKKKKVGWMIIVFPLLGLVLMGLVWGIVICWKRRKLYAEVCEEWEKEYNPQRFSYKNLYLATGGFKEKHFLGVGGFGKVYKGVIPSSGIEVAVKRINHDSRQGMKEFVAEIVSIGRLRHRNLVQLLGYCRRKGELLLVYDYMPNGSLDKVLFENSTTTTLNWPQRQRIIRGVASALLYLHEEWEQVVIHRDIKASNVLLDADLNGRLGDFGLARLHDHGTNSHTTQVAGTVGYLAPELTRLGKATTSTDVFAFGVFMLEVACGRRPVDMEAEEVVLVDLVVKCWQGGDILSAVDSRLEGSYDRAEMELVMRLGLLCSHSVAVLRPSMRKVMQYLDGDTTLPEISLEAAGVGNFPCYSERSDLFLSNFTASRASMNSFCSQDSIITTGR